DDRGGAVGGELRHLPRRWERKVGEHLVERDQHPPHASVVSAHHEAIDDEREGHRQRDPTTLEELECRGHDQNGSGHRRADAGHEQASLWETLVAGWKIGGVAIGPAVVVFTLATEGALLFVAAQTGFVAGPRTLGAMAV